MKVNRILVPVALGLSVVTGYAVASFDPAARSRVVARRTEAQPEQQTKEPDFVRKCQHKYVPTIERWFAKVKRPLTVDVKCETSALHKGDVRVSVRNPQDFAVNAYVHLSGMYADLLSKADVDPHEDEAEMRVTLWQTTGEDEVLFHSQALYSPASDSITDDSFKMRRAIRARRSKP